MVDESRNTVHRHRSDAGVVDDSIHNKLRLIVYRQSPLDFRFSFFHPFLTQAWHFFVVVTVVPTIQRAGCVAPEFATDSVWLHSVFCPRFLIAECLIVGFRAGEISRISGKFRSNATGTLDSWHYADNYNEAPSLSQAWMKEGDAEIQRTLAVDNEPQFIMDTIVDNTSVRPMPMYSIPGLVDHH